MTLVHEQDQFAAESEQLPAGMLTGIVSGTAILILSIVAIVVNITGLRFEDARVAAVSESGYPLLRQTRASALEKLTQYKQIDREKGQYRIPIGRAMDLVIQDALEKSSASSELRLNR